jgi:heme peroxidase
MGTINRHAPPQAALTRSRLPLGNYGWLVYGLDPCPPRSEVELRAIAAAMTIGGGGEHPALPAGYTYFGQFVNHDLSFQSATIGQRRSDPDSLHNFRTPAFDLDCLYARGSQDQPYLYRRDDPSKLLTGRADGFFDLPRNASEQALVGDPRNDEQILVAHFHLAMIEFHNQVVDRLRRDGVTEPEVFEQARSLVTWHYQWVVLHDYLPRILQTRVWDRLHGLVLAGRHARQGLRYFVPSVSPYLPLEFVGAAFRFGHSMVRESYVLNAELHAQREGKPIPPFAIDGDDLRGGRQVPAGWFVDPALFLDFGDEKYQHALRIDTHLSSALARVPVGNSSESLAYLDLRRGQDFRLPSGQELARAMGMERVVAPIDAEGGAVLETPLWYYILREAELEEGGLYLGELGSTIVGEVLVGLMLMDPSSFLSRDPGWTPTLGKEGRFTLSDLVQYAFLGRSKP